MKKKKTKETKQLKKEIRKAKNLKKKTADAMDWSNIEKIEDSRIWLKDGDTTSCIMGVKISPRNILIDTSNVQIQAINNLRIAFNKLNFRIYWGFVFTIVDLEEHVSQLLRQEQQEDDPVILSMIQNDLDKAMWFQEEYRELEFCFMIREKDEKRLLKNLDDMAAEMNHAGFRLKQMNDQDFYNYTAYLYENPMINDYYFSRGVFSCLQEADFAEGETAVYEPDFNYDDYYREDEEHAE